MPVVVYMSHFFYQGIQDCIRRVSEKVVEKYKLIRELTADLEKEREESRKKDDLLRKYEAFYNAMKERRADKNWRADKDRKQQA